MKFKRNDYHIDVASLYNKCKNFLYYHIIFIMKDGSTFDGIVTSVEANRIIVLVGKDIIKTEYKNIPNEQRQYDEDNHRFQRYRRFEPKDVPLTDLTGLYLLPYISPQYAYYPYHPAYHLDYA
ncbi:hypothetical protein D2A34_26285 [Clostridium chromiireducens]|uniref:Uncharacterized protein n=1 Tax=Clostridium chromiireducens TaxID=225345 RepID=A0A399ILJ5_9CLOT|nr:hypothetical protein [Clostridium chromiireducens]RII31876.1 hypothetical protein D2A34_26285 [Clostridium chromiireducens]